MNALYHTERDFWDGWIPAPPLESDVSLGTLLQWWSEHPEVKLNPRCAVCGKEISKAAAFRFGPYCAAHTPDG